MTLTEDLARRAADVVGRRTSRRGFIGRTALVGSALTVAGPSYVLRPGTAYAAVTGSAAATAAAPVLRRLHRVLLPHQRRRRQRVPAGHAARRLVEGRQLRLLLRHRPLLHGLQQGLAGLRCGSSGACQDDDSQCGAATARAARTAARCSGTGTATTTSACVGPDHVPGRHVHQAVGDRAQLLHRSPAPTTTPAGTTVPASSATPTDPGARLRQGPSTPTSSAARARRRAYWGFARASWPPVLHMARRRRPLLRLLRRVRHHRGRRPVPAHPSIAAPDADGRALLVPEAEVRKHHAPSLAVSFWPATSSTPASGGERRRFVERLYRTSSIATRRSRAGAARGALATPAPARTSPATCTARSESRRVRVAALYQRFLGREPRRGRPGLLGRSTSPTAGHLARPLPGRQRRVLRPGRDAGTRSATQGQRVSAVVLLLGIVVGVLALLVVGLLRSHAEILRALHDAGISLDPASTTGPRHRAAAVPCRHQPLGHADVHLRHAAHHPHRRRGPRAPPAPPAAGPSTSPASPPTGGTRTVSVTPSDQATLLAFLTTGCATCADFWEAFAEGVSCLPDTRARGGDQGPRAESPADVAAMAHPRAHASSRPRPGTTTASRSPRTSPWSTVGGASWSARVPRPPGTASATSSTGRSPTPAYGGGSGRSAGATCCSEGPHGAHRPRPARRRHRTRRPPPVPRPAACA
jgi:hypothetical protein